MISGFVKTAAANGVKTNGHKANGDMDVDGNDEDDGLAASQTYGTELKTVPETMPQEVQSIVLVQQEDLEGELCSGINSPVTDCALLQNDYRCLRVFFQKMSTALSRIDWL